jgi:hypothetical protein
MQACSLTHALNLGSRKAAFWAWSQSLVPVDAMEANQAIAAVDKPIAARGIGLDGSASVGSVP